MLFDNNLATPINTMGTHHHYDPQYDGPFLTTFLQFVTMLISVA